MGKISLTYRSKFGNTSRLPKRKVEEGKKAALFELAFVGKTEAQRGAPEKTGFLKWSITGVVNGSSIRISTHDPKAGLLEHGSPPHVIMGAQWLRFYWALMGRMYEPGFKRGFPPPDIVNHPGFEGFHFMEGAVDYLRFIGEDIAAKHMRF